jgi:hypothetical protein
MSREVGTDVEEESTNEDQSKLKLKLKKQIPK